MKMKKQVKEIDLNEHKQKIKKLMIENKKIRQKFNNRSQEYMENIKKCEEKQKIKNEEEKLKELERRRQMIERKMSSKSQIMIKIKQQVLETSQKVKQVKSKKFLYQKNQQLFKSRFLLPKLDEQKRVLERRRQKMKSIDMGQLMQHEKNYQKSRETRKINYSLTTKIIKQQNNYIPPTYIPKSFHILQVEENMKKQFEELKAKQIQLNKMKQKQFAKNVSQLHKIQHQIHRNNSLRENFVQNLQQNNQNSINKSKKRKILSIEERKQVGNQYFKKLIDSIKKIKEERMRKKKNQEEEQKNPLKYQKVKNPQDQLQLQIKTEEIRTIQKIQKVEKIHKIRSKKIQSIFKDQSIDPYSKYEKLQNEVNKLDLMIKAKKINSQDVLERNQAAVCYLDAIKTKFKLLDVTGSK